MALLMASRVAQLKWWQEQSDNEGWHYWSRGSRWYSAYIGRRRYRIAEIPDSAIGRPSWRVTIDHETRAEVFSSASQARSWCDMEEDRRLGNLRWERSVRWRTGWRGNVSKAAPKVGCALMWVWPLTLLLLWGLLLAVWSLLSHL